MPEQETSYGKCVVADVVDCVKHKGKNVMTVWSVEKLELGDADDEVRSSSSE